MINIIKVAVGLPETHDNMNISMRDGAAPRFSGRTSSSIEGSPAKSITDSIRCDASIKRTGKVNGNVKYVEMRKS